MINTVYRYSIFWIINLLLLVNPLNEEGDTNHYLRQIQTKQGFTEIESFVRTNSEVYTRTKHDGKRWWRRRHTKGRIFTGNTLTYVPCPYSRRHDVLHLWCSLSHHSLQMSMYWEGFVLNGHSHSHSQIHRQEWAGDELHVPKILLPKGKRLLQVVYIHLHF